MSQAGIYRGSGLQIKKPLISAVIPAYNTAASLTPLMERLSRVLNAVVSKWEVIIVDDGSTDETFNTALKLREKYAGLGIIRLSENCGQQEALLAGLRASRGERVVTLDADLQHPPEAIPELLKEMDKGFDAVYAVPFRRRDGLHRILGSRLHDLLFNLIRGKQPKARVSSFRVMTGAVVRALSEMDPPFVYISAMMFTRPVRVSHIMVSFGPPSEAGSSYSPGRLARLFLQLAFSYGPLAFFNGAGRKKRGRPYKISEYIPAEVSGL